MLILVSQLIKIMNLKKHYSFSNKSKLSNSSAQKELTFLSYQEEQNKIGEGQAQQSANSICSQPQHINNAESFAPEQRENLKNAFRYICRLCFKESKNYQNQLILLARKHNLPQIHNEVSLTVTTMVNDAQTISGERYFKHYLENINQQSQILVLEYMLWFLKHKYLRYIKNTHNQKGKRKSMKKELYLRFKNEVMMPYLDNLLKIKAE